MIRSAWRGEARKASKPKRATSTREPTIDIISIAQQARPNVAGKSELPRAHETALSSVVVMTRSSTYCSSSLALEVAAQHVAGAQLADAEVVGRRVSRRTISIRALLCARRRSSAMSSSTTKTTISMSAKVPNARSWIATG